MEHQFVKPDFVLLSAKRMLPKVEELSVESPNARIRATFVTDIHLRKRMNGEKIAQSIQNTQGELLILGGDIADNAPQARRMLEMLKTLHFPKGKFAVCGNNDIEAFGSYEAAEAAFENAGIHLLRNSGTLIAQSRIYLAGVEEIRYGTADVSAALRDAPSGTYRILVSHMPTRDLLSGNADLILCGHTHGGQFNFLGITPYCFGYERALHLAQVSGMRAQNNTRMLVSKGIGASKIPLRIGVRSEIHSISIGG